eukprot:gene1401-2765_t
MTQVAPDPEGDVGLPSGLPPVEEAPAASTEPVAAPAQDAGAPAVLAPALGPGPVPAPYTPPPGAAARPWSSSFPTSLTGGVNAGATSPLPSSPWQTRPAQPEPKVQKEFIPVHPDVANIPQGELVWIQRWDTDGNGYLSYAEAAVAARALRRHKQSETRAYWILVAAAVTFCLCIV